MADNRERINSGIQFDERHMPRDRVDKILDTATRCKLVYVIAGVGYGKTQAVYNYINKQPDAVVRWLQLTESDNIVSYYWENLTHNIALDNPELSFKLRELGFPDTPAGFKQFTEIIKTTEHRSHKTFLVLDDFHLITSEKALNFAERCAHLSIPGACVIIISRKEPGINTVSLFSAGKASIITEDELRFTEAETEEFIRRQNISFSQDDLSGFIDSAKGWVLALELLVLVLKRTPGNIPYALEVMKNNIFKLFELEAFNDFSEDVKKNLIKLSLVSDLPVMALRLFFEDTLFIENTPQLSSFIWFDSLIGDYRIHPFYLEFLQCRQDVLSDAEKQDAYRLAAGWCHENKFYTAAVKYYAQSGQFNKIVEILLSYPFKLPPDACEYFLDILKNSELDGREQDAQSVWVLKCLFMPLLLMGAGRYEAALEQSFDIIKKWEHDPSQFAAYLLYSAYRNLAYTDIHTCTAVNKYNFAEYMKKAVEYSNMFSAAPVSARGAFTVVDVRSYACLVGEDAKPPEIERFLETTRETAVYIAQTYHNMYLGYDELAACEVAFFKNRLKEAKQFAGEAVKKAREKKQYSIEMMAQHYLLRAAACEGNYPLAKELLKQLGAYLDNPDVWNRRLLYDLFAGFFYIQTGLPDLAAPWLVTDEEDNMSKVRIPIRELITGVKYHIARRSYDRALAVLNNSYPREPRERFLFGELTLTLLGAAARIKLDDTAGALADFHKAYGLSHNGIFEMPFIELGKNLRPLTSAALKQPDCVIPEEWLKLIERKASVYSKQTAYIMKSFKKETKTEDSFKLSEREREALSDLCRGLSREEIAVNRYLSINTVKKILQSVYIKLDAANSTDAVRIALEKKLIDD
ncbi:MAG: LuxR C-terminal-related transcriptional regulator [Oscillospiraceae bacterium]|nr:LuxR C-terminal-related transcriptional regulator [Oscillospiraceae bacterium]